MSRVVSGLIRLTDDHDRYKDVFINGFSRIAMKDFVFEKVTRCFDENVFKNLTKAFPSDDPFGLLGIGVGQGQHELHFVKNLARHFTSINNVVVEPNESLLGAFKRDLASVDSDTIISHWFPDTMARFFDGSPLAKCKYNLITAIHSLYHSSEVEATFDRMASLLKEKGYMIIVHGSENNLITRTHLQETWLPISSSYHEEPHSAKLRKAAEKMGYDVAIFHLNVQWDLTDLFDEQSDLAEKLPDFFTMTAHFRKTVPVEIYKYFMSLWRSMCYEDPDGHILTSAKEEILLISK